MKIQLVVDPLHALLIFYGFFFLQKTLFFLLLLAAGGCWRVDVQHFVPTIAYPFIKEEICEFDVFFLLLKTSIDNTFNKTCPVRNPFCKPVFFSQ